jgi:hypothetical protein
MGIGDTIRHEAIGIVEEVGPKVKDLKVGDRVIILPVIACGECFYCRRKEYTLCDKTNLSKEMEAMYGHRLSGIFGYSHLIGGYAGDQAEYSRVPNADLTYIKNPQRDRSHQDPWSSRRNHYRQACLRTSRSQERRRGWCLGLRPRRALYPTTLALPRGQKGLCH